MIHRDFDLYVYIYILTKTIEEVHPSQEEERTEAREEIVTYWLSRSLE